MKGRPGCWAGSAAAPAGADAAAAGADAAAIAEGRRRGVQAAARLMLCLPEAHATRLIIPLHPPLCAVRRGAM